MEEQKTQEEKKEEEIEVENTGYYTCETCGKIPKITINKETLEIELSCICNKEDEPNKTIDLSTYIKTNEKNKTENKHFTISTKCEGEDCNSKYTLHCKDCGLNLCGECRKKHQASHQIIDIEEKYPEELLKKRCEIIEEWDSDMKKYYNRFQEALEDLQQNLDQRKNELKKVVEESQNSSEFFKSLILAYNATKQTLNYNVRNNLLDNDFGAVLSFRQKILKNQAKTDMDNSKLTEFLKQGNIKVSKANQGDFLKESSVLKTPEEIALVMEWLNGKGTVTGGKLVYKGTVDGDSYENFIDKCQNVGATISFFISDNGKRFGGFTKANWTKQDINSVYQNDPDAFLFSLDNKRPYFVKDAKHAIKSSFQFCQMYGNTFNVDGLIISLNYLTKECSYENHRKEHGPVYDLPSANELTGKEKFKVLENEVFQIEFE